MISILVHILIIAAIFIVLIRKISGVDDKMLFSAFMLLKISCGILIGFLYWSYYGGIGDTIYFYEQAQALFQYFQLDKISFLEWIGFAPISLSQVEFSAQTEPRTFFFVRLMSFLYAFTQGNYFSMSIYLSFFSGIATWKFARQLVKLSKENKFVIYTALLFIPSITFWSSGLMKESLMTIAIYALGFSVLKLVAKPSNWLYAILAILSVFVLWKVKYYVPIALLPILVLTLLFNQTKFLGEFSFPKKLLLYVGLLIVGGTATAFIHPVFHSGRFFELIRISHDVIAQNSFESLIQFQLAENDVLFLIQNLPLAWFTGIFRPFIWESFSFFSLVWAIEKTIFTLLAIAASTLFLKLKFSQAEKWLGLGILIYVSILSSVITLATPNFGSLIRYEVAYMPFLWLLVLMVLNKYKHNLK
ncbi:hypothetical protein MATR_25880 [Marivirga tractuosa]|uniref:Glycosyltransferase RgtA/B/C/D-like domain-containing protein n=1 Tax=Marivirga tractuosa (strain ATCC 23168 / DSM 4126 / NBRC 15989 / NCIMB 1408 / VKM B-1430 / H-43) TaxID=643867 RepID=E4TP24_MARTH|nr:hypothetical protein [Marivirga tractuosa]ADR23558.1 hypothetical protein Ftrac_3588 [Marivirga tractuosa DSM 4126]BDD15763.1 hypothetical protein MATR_25880 [Marivirga tractuosa]